MNRYDAEVGGHLDAAVLLRRGSFTLDASLTAQPGEIVAVLGPNGAGKSTLLGVLAGLSGIDEGSVVLDGRTLTSGGVLVPPERRRVGLMGQDPLLFPHLTALENIAFGPRAQGVPKARARAIARDWLGRMGLDSYADRRPTRLSGGQRQRVALARALAAGPALLLLDEPLGALDAVTAPQIRQVLRTHLHSAGVTTLLVTHDVLDAATLADQVVVLAGGSVVDSGPTAMVLAAPRTEFTASLAGLNMVIGTTEAASAAQSVVALTQPGARPADGGAIRISGIAAEALAGGLAATAVFPPSAVAVYLEPITAGSPRNSWPATVVALEPGPSAIRLTGAVGERTDSGESTGAGPILLAADLTPAAVAELGLGIGSRVNLAVKATEVRVHGRYDEGRDAGALTRGGTRGR